MTMHVSVADEIMKRARQRIEAGWAQYQSTDKRTNSVCLTRAINEAADEIQAQLPEMPAYEVQRGSSQAHKFVGPDTMAEVSSRVNQAIGELMPGTPIKGSMIAFNDNANTSQADVLAVLDRALALNK
jgi:hypothetical protein